MVNYNPKDWLTFIFRFHKADTFRTLTPMMITVGLYALVIAELEIDIIHISETSSLKNFSALHTLIGFALSMLLVFRTNTAYERWWEGRKLWGSLVNNSRAMAMKIEVMLPANLIEDRFFFATMIGNYADVLRTHLRNQKNSSAIECDGFSKAEIKDIVHQPNYIATKIFERINTLYVNKKISNEQYLILNNEMTAYIDVCGACERIKNTPIPFSYSSFLKKFIFFYVMTLPFGYVVSLKYLMIPLSIFIFYVLASLELIAEEIENPFGTDDNDLPTDAITKSIKENSLIIIKHSNKELD
jgi:putative membrane protein